MAENGFCDELPEDVLEMHESTARSLANLWTDGCEAARQAIFAALCRETLRMAAFAEARDMARAGAAGGADGFVLVPREPTPEMLKAAWDAYAAHEWDLGRAKRGPERESLPIAYRALIEAAPPPPAQQGSSSPPLTAERVDLGELKTTHARRAAWKAAGCWAGDRTALDLLDDIDTLLAERGAHLFPASLPGGTGSADEGTDLVSYLERQWAWSKETFGPALRTKGIVQHITKELREIEAEPHDLAEWVDVIILAMDGFWRHGGKPADLLPTMQAKQDRNFARTWPDWRTMGEDQAIEHDRSGEAALATLHASQDQAGEVRA